MCLQIANNKGELLALGVGAGLVDWFVPSQRGWVATLCSLPSPETRKAMESLDSASLLPGVLQPAQQGIAFIRGQLVASTNECSGIESVAESDELTAVANMATDPQVAAKMVIETQAGIDAGLGFREAAIAAAKKLLPAGLQLPIVSGYYVSRSGSVSVVNWAKTQGEVLTSLEKGVNTLQVPDNIKGAWDKTVNGLQLLCDGELGDARLCFAEARLDNPQEAQAYLWDLYASYLESGRVDRELALELISDVLSSETDEARSQLQLFLMHANAKGDGLERPLREEGQKMIFQLREIFVL